MDQIVLSSAITAAASVLTCFIGLRSGEKNASIPSTKKILEMQLSSFYAPIDMALNFERTEDLKELIPILRRTINDNYVLVPPIIISEFLSLEKIETPAAKDFNDIRIAVSSFYNWTKKSLGYPYYKKAIKKSLTPNSGRNRLVKSYINKAALLAVGGGAGISIATLIRDGSSAPPPVKIVVLLVALFGAITVLTEFSSLKYDVYITTR